MREKDIRELYPITPQAHARIAATLEKLPQEADFRRVRRLRRIAAAAVAAILIAALTTAAYATNLFGIISKKVGNYGLNISVVKETEAADSPTAETFAPGQRHVRLKLGYTPDGYMPITGEDGFTEPYKYSYGGKPEGDRWGFSFLLYSADSYDRTETGIVEYNEETVDGRKIVFMTQQFDENGEFIQYLAAKYFDDFDTVVVGYCANETELAKIMRALELEEDTDYAEPETFADEFYVPEDDYAFLGYEEEYRAVRAGESFGYSPAVYDDGRVQEPEFTLSVESIEERDSAEGLERGSFLYGDRYSEYFDGDGKLIAEYPRDDQENGDGINELTRRWQTQTERHFILVTVKATANQDMEYFNGFKIWSAPLIQQNGGWAHPDTRGRAVLIYSDGAEYSDRAWRKGETRSLTYGVAVDDEALDMACLIFETDKTVIDHSAQTAKRVTEHAVVKLKGGAGHD